MEINLEKNWFVLQDIHDAGEQLALYQKEDFLSMIGPQMSEWEEIPALKHLQLLFSETPYWGRELRYFNYAPWWYKNEFELNDTSDDRYILTFTNVDYYCKVWLNGIFAGEHEGYSIPFSFDVTPYIKNGTNRLIVKVWSPWDTQVDHDNELRRTTDVFRNMVKGTYEHSDTFIPRDVNPVGIYGSVILKSHRKSWFQARPEFSYILSEDLKDARIFLKAAVETCMAENVILHMECTDNYTKKTVFQTSYNVFQTDTYIAESLLNDINLWSTWDQGIPYTYLVDIWIEDPAGNILDRYTETTGFRKIEMIRDTNQTTFLLNQHRFYVRGTAYFPDNYISAMNKDRYRRDILAIKACGFNMIRVHVHVDLPEFYELCTEIGIGIMHDSEYNWAHPFTDEFADRFIHIYLQTVDMLKIYPSILCWICMNEPGLLDTAEKTSRSHSRSMDINPGPVLYESVCRHDPTRPVIKGSFCADDPYSGDSHNYLGSLYGEKTHYSNIYGTVEKLNTEYGFDAPPCTESLKKIPAVYKRLQKIEQKIPQIQNYQYQLLKYYTEHYRMQKYAPNSGYIQFLFNDIGPTSYYGLYDWWGIPKKGLMAMLESNMPVGIFIKYNDKIDAIYVVNDLPNDLGVCTAFWHITDSHKNTLSIGEQEIYLRKDEKVLVTELGERFGNTLNVSLILRKDKDIIAHNQYEDIYHMPPHPDGHPSRMSHEFGVRLYFA
ncbi:MAG: beta-galactosidase [Lachnospiraceae bacterium]|nr:beta-galactosidase [Lachnospiraceae bacterium]